MSATAKQSRMLRAALRYAARGWRVIPLEGKLPITAHAYKDGSVDPMQLKGWWGEYPLANVGIVVGPESGICVLDIDPRAGGAENANKILAIPQTLTVVTGGGGRHVFFRYPAEGLVSRNGALGPGLDVKAAGGYIIAPGSGHISGGVYAWEVTHHPDEVPLADAPAWLLAAARVPTATNGGATRGRVTIPEAIPEGQRNERLYQLARSLRAQGMAAGAVLAALLKVNAEQCRPPLPDAEVADLVQHAMSQSDRADFAAAPSSPTNPQEPEHLTDLGNAQRFGRQHGARAALEALLDALGWPVEPALSRAVDRLLQLEEAGS